MDQIIGEIFGRAIGGLIGLAIDTATQSKKDKRNRASSTGLQSRNLDVTPSASIQHGRAVLIASSTITFGNDCERLINIAFQTSQTFPSMMSTYADVIQYLRKELGKHYSNEYFHIIISENDQFGFSVDDGQYYAEIEQERYRILIFAPKRNPNIKMDTHDVDSQMRFNWN